MSNLRIKSKTKKVTPDTAFRFNNKNYLSTRVSMGHHYYYIINRHVLQSEIRLRKGGRRLYRFKGRHMQARKTTMGPQPQGSLPAAGPRNTTCHSPLMCIGAME
jgi:hypothetical protein